MKIGIGSLRQVRPERVSKTGGRSPSGEVAVTYASDADEAKINRAIALAQRRQTRLTVVIPVPQPSLFSYLSPDPLPHLNAALEAEAESKVKAVFKIIPRVCL